MLTANTSAMAMKGRNLFQAITQANIEREQAGLQSVWPKDGTSKSDDTDDIAGNVYDTAEKYFQELFDIARYGQEDRSPYVEVDIGVLSGSGVTPFAGSTTLDGKNVGWCVAQGLTDEMEDIVPALITRNANVENIPAGSGQHDMSSDKTEVKMGAKNGGVSDTPFGNKAFIVIRKGGAAETIKAKYNKLYLVFKKQSYTIPQSVTFKYLTPSAK